MILFGVSVCPKLSVCLLRLRLSRSYVSYSCYFFLLSFILYNQHQNINLLKSLIKIENLESPLNQIRNILRFFLSECV